MSIVIFYPEGGGVYTEHVDEADIQSHIAGRSWHADEAMALQEFMTHDYEDDGNPIPLELFDGALVLAEEGELNGIPFAHYRERDAA